VEANFSLTNDGKIGLTLIINDNDSNERELMNRFLYEAPYGHEVKWDSAFYSSVTEESRSRYFINPRSAPVRRSWQRRLLGVDHIATKTVRRFRYIFLGAGIGCAFDALVIIGSGAQYELWFAGAAAVFFVLFVIGTAF